jgi:hypothetical protein
MRQSRKVSGSITVFGARFSMCVVPPQVNANEGSRRQCLPPYETRGEFGRIVREVSDSN